MAQLRTFELIGGLATGLLGINTFLLALRLDEQADHAKGNNAQLSLADLALGSLFWLGPPLLVVIGSYVHAIRLKLWGFVLLWIGGVFLALMFLFLLFAGGKFLQILYFGWWKALSALAPGAAAIVTLILSYAVGARSKL